AEVPPRRADHAVLRGLVADRDGVEGGADVGLRLRADTLAGGVLQGGSGRVLQTELLLGDLRADGLQGRVGFLLGRVARRRGQTGPVQAEPALRGRGRAGRGARRRRGGRPHGDRLDGRRRLVHRREAQVGLGPQPREAHLLHDRLDRELRQRRLRGRLVGVAAEAVAGGIEQAVLVLRSRLDRAVRESGDLHLDGVAGDEQQRLAHAERVDAVADVLERAVHDLLGRPRRRLEDHGHPALEIEPEDRLGPGRERDDRSHDEQRHERDREPQVAGGLHASSAPLIVSLKRQSRTSAAFRHICMRPRKISRYSMTWLISVSIVSSSVTVLAAESTRRNDCSAAKFTRSWMSNWIWPDLRTRLRWTSDLSARMTAAETGDTAYPFSSSWMAMAETIVARSCAGT